MSKITLGLFFGGRSTEHEVSVITALQAYEHLDKSKYNVVAVYVAKNGQFYTGEQFLDLKNYRNLDNLLLSNPQVTLEKRQNKAGLVQTKVFPKFTTLDIAMPLFHGSFGEDGAIQGAFETFGLPYTGLNVMGAAVAMDKVISKSLFTSLDLPVAKSSVIRRLDWWEDPKKCLALVKKELKYPVFIKPADIGSTIGINKANNDDELQFNIEVAAVYSDKILIEEAFQNCIEVNCAALGYHLVTPSVCEMPISTGESLSFDDKYLRGGKGSKGAGMASLTRQIPAPISDKLSKQIQEATVKVFQALEGCGVARIDYFVDPKTEKFWINEVNSPPGSLAFYLYQPLGISYSQLLDRLVSDGLQRAEDQKKTQFSFDTPLLQQMAVKGLHGGSKNK